MNGINIFSAKILVVDDREDNIALLRRTLQDAGYVAIFSTTNPADVRDLHLRNHFDLILLDLEMPVLNGFQVMEGLKEIELENYLPIMVLTAHPDHKLRALQSGARDFISKPFDLAEVLIRVRNMLEIRLLHQATREQSRLLESLVRNDPLTGLGNRRLLAERMTMAIAHARRKKQSMAVVYLDLDGFKQINDIHGHHIGDLVLQGVATRLGAMVREEDTLVRLGGDEFLIVLADLATSTSFENASTVATKAIHAVAPTYELEGQAIHITTSAGIGIYPIHGEDAEALLKSADAALYQAKHAGRNGYRIFGQDPPSDAFGEPPNGSTHPPETLSARSSKKA